MSTYKIVRLFFDRARAAGARRTVMRGLTLEQAQAHCQNPQTSSSTCTDRAGRKRTERYGPWFDGYDKE